MVEAPCFPAAAVASGTAGERVSGHDLASLGREIAGEVASLVAAIEGLAASDPRLALLARATLAPQAARLAGSLGRQGYLPAPVQVLRA